MKLLKTHSEHELKRIKKTLKKIENLRPTMQQLTDEQLQAKTTELKDRLKKLWSRSFRKLSQRSVRLTGGFLEWNRFLYS